MSEQSETTHAHPSYVGIWVFLVLALGASWFIGDLRVPIVSGVLVFTFAIVKAYLVLAYYMHLKFEPFFCSLILVSAVVALYCMFLGVMPDIVYPPLK
jgi:caa(3)-type oxidase subunit IV